MNRKNLYLFIAFFIWLFAVMPNNTVEAANKEPFYKFKGESIYKPYVRNDGSLVFGVNHRIKNAQKMDLLTVSEKGKKIRSWSERGVGYIADDLKGNKQVYVYDSAKGTIKAFDDTHKKRWQKNIAKGVDLSHLGINGGFFYEEPRGDNKTQTKGLTYTGKPVTFSLRYFDENIVTGSNDQVAYHFDYDYAGSYAYLRKLNDKGKVAWSKDIYKMDHNKGSGIYNYYIFQDDQQGVVYIRVGYSKYEGKKDVILLYALSSSGKMIWKKNINQSDTYNGNIIGDTFFYTGDGKAVFLNRKTGKTIKTIKTNDYVRLHAKDGNILYFSYNNYLTAVSSKGTTLWKYKIPKGKSINQAKVDRKKNIYIAFEDEKNRSSYDFVKVSNKGKQLKKYTYNALNSDFIEMELNSKKGVLYPFFNKGSNKETTIIQYKY